MGFTFKVKVILKNINQEFNLTLPFGLTPPTGPRTGGVLRAAPAVGPRALRPCPLPDRLLRSLRQRVGPKGAGEEEGWVTGEGWEIGEGVVVVKGIGFIILSSPKARVSANRS